MSPRFSMNRRSLIASAIAATAAGLTCAVLPAHAEASDSLRTRNLSAVPKGSKVLLGSVALACLTDRKRQITVGGGFRSKGSASSNVVATTLAGLTEADYQAAADAAYTAAVAELTAQGFEVVDHGTLLALLKADDLIKANGGEYSVGEGNKQSSKATMVGASAFGGYVPLPGWTPSAPGLAGIASIGLQTAASKTEALFQKHAEDAGVTVIGLLLGVSPVRIDADFGSEWRVPDAFGNGGQTDTGTLTTETGLSSHPLLTRMTVFPTSGDSPGEIAMDAEIGIQGGIGTLADSTSGAVKGVQAAGNLLSMLGGSGRSSKITNYTLDANAAAYVAGTGALSADVVKALAAELS